MYFSLYKSIRSLLADGFGMHIDETDGRIMDASDSPVKDIQWFADQYDRTIHTAPVVLVEFQDLDFTKVTKQKGNVLINIRIHVVTETESESDGDVLYPSIEAHERLAVSVRNMLEGWCLDFAGGETRPIYTVKWGHNHNYRGYMVTWIELETKGQLPAVV